MDNRRYVKRIWRVPTDRGALEYLGALVLKALVKHGWPARLVVDDIADGFYIFDASRDGPLPPDFERAFGIAVRIAARTYRIEVSQYGNFCQLDRPYRVTSNRKFALIK